LVTARHDGGQVLLVALVVLLLGSMAAAVLASSLMLRLRLAREEALEIHVQALTDAAMAEALAALARDASFAGFSPHPLEGDPGGLIWSRVEPLAPPRVLLHAGGSQGPRQRVVSAEVALGGGPPRVLSWKVSRQRAESSDAWRL
jgi:hypothetical protein